MLAIDEAKLDNLYQQVLQIETDMMLESEKSGELYKAVRLKVRRENQEIRALRESRRDELLESASSNGGALRSQREEKPSFQTSESGGQAICSRCWLA